MKQGIVGGLLIVGGAIFSLFVPQVLGLVKTLSFTVPSVTLSAGIYVWTLWAHGGSDVFLGYFLMVLWGALLVDAGAFMIGAFIFAVKAVEVFTLNQTRNTRIAFDEIVSCLGYSCVAFFICLLFLYLASWMDVGIGAWTTKSPLFTEDIYNSLFFWGAKGYLYVYPLSMVVAGLFILKESCRKWRQGVLHG